MKLIICEKSTLGKTVAKAIGIEKWEDGYVKCKDEYIVTWAKGHLFQLYDVDDYEEKKLKWEEIPLPYFPQEFLYKLKTDKEGWFKKQFSTIKKLIKEYKIDTIVNCGDADREGQIIVDIIADKLDWKGSMKRLWLPEQTEQTIRKQLLKLEDNSKYINLANEGYARTFMDWLLGINLSVYITNKTGQYMNVGRVMIPIVKYIYDRDIAIKNFTKSTYYQAESITEKDGIKVTLTKNKKYENKQECDEIVNSLPSTAIVTKIEKKEIKKTPKKLFSLSNLQSELSRKNKISLKTSMKVIQSLYEDGYITYPRTNIEYLSEEEMDKVQAIIDTIKGIPLKVVKTKRIFDNSKIESHSAITPTVKVPTDDDFSELEALVYNTIKNRFIANFLDEETLVEKTTITIQVGSEEFKLKGETIKKEGFLKYNPEKIENQLPNLEEKEEFQVNFKTVEKETQPPKKITEEDLLNYLKNPFRTEKTTEDEEYAAILKGVTIGTEATWTPTIEKCKETGYISLKGSNYSIELLGEKLIESLDKLHINLYKDKTVEFSEMQKKVYKGEETIENLLNLTRKEIEAIVNSNIEIEKVSRDEVKEIIGFCPRCGKPIFESDKSFYCSGYKDEENKCDFTLWKEQKFPNTKITKANAKTLLSGKTIHLKKLKSKTGKEYEADFKLKDDGTKYIHLELVPKEFTTETIGVCPRCGRNILEGTKSFYCEGYKDEENKCNFTLWKEQKYPSVTLSKGMAKALLSGGDIQIKDLKSKQGKSYSAYFGLVDDGERAKLKMTKFANEKKK